jgi:hypothetical protein
MSDKKYSAGEVATMIVAAPFVYAGLVLVGIPFSLWSAFVTQKLWNWFAAPYFNLRPITFLVMWGINVLIGRYAYQDFAKDRKIDWSNLFLTAAISPALALLIGWFIHKWVQP